MKVHFSTLFAVKSGTISPKVRMNINGSMISPGSSFSASDHVIIGGIRLFDCMDKFLETEERDGIYYINGDH